MTDHPASSGPAQRPPLPPRRPAPPAGGYAPEPRRGSGIFAKVLTSLAASILILSVILNFYLGAIVYSVYSGPSEEVYAAGDPMHRIVVVPIDGAIGEDTARSFRNSMNALEGNLPKAIVLRVNSPGGGITASDQVWYRLSQFKEEHPDVPVIASFGSVAASGGYYISAPADFIMAETTTITGSIGVIATGFTISDMLEKIGVTPEVITSTDSVNKDTGSMYRPWTEQDREVIKGLLDSGYERFVTVVKEGRRAVLTEEEVRGVATGEIFTAAEAQEAGLIDGIGYLDDALDKAVELAGIPADVTPHITVIREPEPFNPFALVSSGVGGMEALTAQRLRALALELGLPAVSYRAPISMP
ncbi:signal peptide peptidase SppA [Mucisphaera sp.]|uniref:signal peptide peptidase SppA n=1 Tax=Mucisphaera sp. TaxID=2913024 RepID=UPI003D0C6C2F